MKTFVFVKRNLKECGRDPVTYIFCLASASGILGGAWMPLDIMGGFEKF